MFSLYVIWCHVNHRTPIHHSHQYPGHTSIGVVLCPTNRKTPSQPDHTTVDRQPLRPYHTMRHRPTRTRSFSDTLYIFLVSVVNAGLIPLSAGQIPQERSRLTIKLDRLIELTKSSLLGWFLQVSLIVIIKQVSA